MNKNRMVIYLCMFLVVICIAVLLFVNLKHKNEVMPNEELVMEDSSSIEVNNNQSIVILLYAGS